MRSGRGLWERALGGADAIIIINNLSIQIFHLAHCFRGHITKCEGNGTGKMVLVLTYIPFLLWILFMLEEEGKQVFENSNRD